MWGKNEGACVPRWRGETRRGRLRAEGRRLLSGNRGRSAEGCRNDRENEPPYLRSTPRYNGLRASGRRGVPPLDGHRGRSTEGCRNDRAGAPSVCKQGASVAKQGAGVRLPRGAVARWTTRSVGRRVPQRSSKCAIALWEARARAERPPLWGSDDVSAMRNYRYRHRDSPYVAKRSGERTSRAGRPWAVGGELPGARWRGRPVCAMRSAVQGAAAAQTRACRFFSSTSTLGCGAQGAGGAERRTDQFSVRLF